MKQAIAHAEAELAELSGAGLPEFQTAESDSPAPLPDERAATARQQIEQWQQILQKLE